MTRRDVKIEIFYDFTEAAIAKRAETCANAGPAAKPVFDALRTTVGEQGNFAPERLPVCDALESALQLASAGPAPIPELAAALNNLSPRLQWKRRNSSSPDGTNFYDGHANALVAGPGGLEERDDVWIKFLDRKGKLTVGYGSPGCIGPELGFGNVAGRPQRGG